MIKFFRTIRLKLLTENRLSKYFFYAIGEIVLVVIGILVALSVNNWNENRKNQKEERALLMNIQNDIVRDTLDLGFNREFHKKALKNEILLLGLINGDPSVKADSINFLDALGIKLIIIVHNSSFKNLTYNSPNLISNKILKQKIDRHYDFFYTALAEAQNNQPEYNLYAKLLPYFKKHFFLEGKVTELVQSNQGNKDFFDYKYERNSIRPIDINAMQNDREFAVELSEVIFYRSTLISGYDEAFARVASLYQEINDELNKK